MCSFISGDLSNNAEGVHGEGIAGDLLNSAENVHDEDKSNSAESKSSSPPNTDSNKSAPKEYDIADVIRELKKLRRSVDKLGKV